MKKMLLYFSVIVMAIAATFFFSLRPDVPLSDTGPFFRIAVAGNFEGGGDCHDHYRDGCDIYTAILNGATGQVSEVRRLTDDVRAEAFPSLTPDGNTIVFTRYKETNGDAWAVRLDGTQIYLAQNTMHPEVVSNDTFLASSFPGSKLTKITLDATDHTSSQLWGSVVNAHEPRWSAENSAVLFYAGSGEGRGSRTAQAWVVFPDTGKTVAATESDGSAHCFWGYAGKSIYCNNAAQGGVIVRLFDAATGTIGAPSVGIKFPSKEEIIKIDEGFADCVSVSLAYGSSCGPDHLLITAECGNKTEAEDGLEATMTRVILKSLKTNQLFPIGLSMAEVFSNGTDSWTSDCQLISETK